MCKMENKENAYSSNWVNGFKCIDQPIMPNPLVAFKNNSYVRNYGASIPYCDRDLLKELWIKYWQYPSQFTAIGLVSTKLDRVNALQFVKGLEVTTIKDNIAKYDPFTGIIKICKPGIYRIIATSFIIDKCRQENYPTLAFYCTNSKCLIGDDPIVAKYGIYNHFVLGAEIIFIVNDKYNEFAILNVDSNYLYLMGSLNIEYLADI